MWVGFQKPLASLSKTRPQEMEVKDSEARVGMNVANCILIYLHCLLPYPPRGLYRPWDFNLPLPLILGMDM